MGTLSAQRSRAARHPPTAHDTAALVQFAIDQVLRCEADFDGLPSVLERLAGSWDAEAALALALHPGGAPAVLAGYPDEVTSRTMLPAAIVALVQAHPAAVAAVRSGGSMQAPLAAGEWSDRPVSALVAWAAAGAGEQRCAVVLIGDPASWDAQTRATTRMLAAVVAAQFRHAGDLAFLQEREAVTKALIDASPDAVLVMDAERRVAAFNPAAEKLYGWQREDVLGKDMASMLIPEHDRARFLAGTESFLARRDPGEFTGRMNLPVLRADGSEQMVEMTPLPLVVRGQVYFCGFLRDLAESERAQAALEAQAEDFRLLARRAPVGIAETSPDGRCSFVNERWCVLNGGTAADFLGKPWLSVVHQEDLGRIRHEWARATAGGTELETDCRLRDGARAVTWARVGVAALPHGANGAPGSWSPHRRDRPQGGGTRHEVRLAIEEETSRGLVDRPGD